MWFNEHNTRCPLVPLAWLEDELFDGLMVWAFTKCEKLKLPKTSQNARKMLGEAFYYIRFPMMNPQNFTNKVANIAILTDLRNVNIGRSTLGAGTG
jgi:hypothetical protein